MSLLHWEMADMPAVGGAALQRNRAESDDGRLAIILLVVNGTDSSTSRHVRLGLQPTGRTSQLSSAFGLSIWELRFIFNGLQTSHTEAGFWLTACLSVWVS